MAPYQIHQADDTRFAAHVVRRVREAEIPDKPTAADRRLMVAEVTIDLLLACIPGDAFDRLLASAMERADRGDRSAQHQVRILDKWAAGQLSGPVSSLADVAPLDPEGLRDAAVDLIATLLTPVAAANPYRVEAVKESLIAEVGRANLWATSCLALLRTVAADTNSTHSTFLYGLPELSSTLETHRPIPTSAKVLAVGAPVVSAVAIVAVIAAFPHAEPWVGWFFLMLALATTLGVTLNLGRSGRWPSD